jgi:peptidyl-prolyl cis-trans isomerase SurA
MKINISKISGQVEKMMKKAFVIILLCTAALMARPAFSQENEVIAEVGKEEITFGQLKKAFEKNLNRKNHRIHQISRDSLYDFLELYLKFRLKVNDAIGRGYENDSAVIADIQQNRKILAESFLYDKTLIEPNVDKMVERRKKEYKIAIIMSTYNTGLDKDTAAALEKIQTAMKELKAGRDFASVAREYSDDTEFGPKGGEVPNFITSGKLQRKLEEPIYNTPPGEFYPEIIETRFGYFIIKVLEEYRREFVRASQILVVKTSAVDSTTAVNFLDSLKSEINNGADFAKLAGQHSDDTFTAENGGEFESAYSRSTGFKHNNYPLLPAFERELFKLKDGEVSGIVETEYGWHLIKRLETFPANPEDERADIKSTYRRLYYKDDKEAYLDSLAVVYGFDINDETLDKFIAGLDTNATNLKDAWDSEIPESLKSETLYSIFDNEVSVSDFIEKMNNVPGLRGLGTNEEGLRRAIDMEVEPLVFNKATENLEENFPEFNELMKEFRDGILLFKVEALEVWNKLKFDSTLAKMYWDTTKANYMTDTLYDISEIYVYNDSLAKALYNDAIENGNFEQLASDNTQRTGFRNKNGSHGILDAKKNNLAEHAKKTGLQKGDISEPFKHEAGYSIIMVKDVLPPRQKSFEEAIPDFASKFQDQMQKHYTEKWLDKVKEKFPVEIHEDKLDKIISKLKSK